MDNNSNVPKTEASSMTNQPIEKLLGLTTNQLELLAKENKIRELKSLQQEFIFAETRPSRMIAIALCSLGYGCFSTRCT